MLFNNLSEDVKTLPHFQLKKKLKSLGVTSSCKYVNVGSRKENILHWQLKNKARNLNLFFKSHFYQMNSHMYVKNVVIIYKTLNSNLLSAHIIILNKIDL